MKLPVSSKGVSPVDEQIVFRGVISSAGMGSRIRGMRTRVDMKYHETL